MKTFVTAFTLAAALFAAGCSLPDAKGPVRVCVPDSAICYFEEQK